MKYEKSCGAVVFTKSSGDVRYLIISNLQGVTGFPKGHVENGETETETALREVYEETSLKVKLIEGFRETDEHAIPDKENTMKEIVYFLGEYENQEPVYQKEELSDMRLMNYSEAMEALIYESSKRILKKANDFILNMKY